MLFSVKRFKVLNYFVSGGSEDILFFVEVDSEEKDQTVYKKCYNSLDLQ
jgi:hypothetical protein